MLHLVADEGVPENLGQLRRSEREVGAFATQGSANCHQFSVFDSFVWASKVERRIGLSICEVFVNSICIRVYISL